MTGGVRSTVGGGAGGGGSVDLAGYATQSWVDENYLSIDFFSSLFKAYDSAATPNEIVPNGGDTTAITNIRAMFGFWTEQYLSALGQNSGGGGGGTVLTEPLSSINSAGLGTPTSAGQVITWDGTQWVFAIPSGGGGGGGTVTQITAGTGLSGGTITTIGTISIDSTYQTYIAHGQTAYGWGDHAQAGYATQTWVGNQGYLTGITAAMINAALGFTLSGTAGATYNLATIASNAADGETAYGWGNHANAGYALAADVYTKTAADAKFLTISAFENLFNAIASDGTTKIDAPYASSVASIKAMFGLWTEQYLSALGQNSGGGASALTDLSDVAISSPANGDALVYNATSQKWVNQAIGGGSGTLTQIGLVMPTGFAVSPATLTANGSFTVTFSSGYSLPTTADVAKGVTAYGWGNHANAGYATESYVDTELSSYATLNDISDMATQTWVGQQGYLTGITSAMINSALGFTLTGTAGSTYALATINTRADEGHTAYGWGDHAQAGYLTSSSNLNASNINSGTIGFSYLPTMYWANVAVSNQSSLTTSPQFANVRLQSGSSLYGSYLRFGDQDNAYIAELGDDTLTYYTTDGHIFNGGTITANTDIEIASGYELRIGGFTIEYDSTNQALKFNGSIYATGGVSALGQSSGGSGGATALADLTDVDITSPANGDALLYNGNTGKWYNGTVSSGGGTVTRVEMTVPTGFAISGSPITSSGTLALTFASGYALPTTADVNKGVTAYGWGNHANAGYATENYVDNELNSYALLSDISDMATETWVGQQGFLTSVAFADLTSHPSTLSGYGITDALGSSTTFWGQTASGGAVSGNMTSVGSISMSGGINMDNNTHLQMKDSGGYYRSLFTLNSNNLFAIGNGARTNGYTTDLQGYTIMMAVGTTRTEAFEITTDGRCYVKQGTQGLRIGDGLITWDSTNNALKISDKDGNAANLYALGGVSALGFSNGSNSSVSVGSLTTGSLYIKNGSYQHSILDMSGDLEIKAAGTGVIYLENDVIIEDFNLYTLGGEINSGSGDIKTGGGKLYLDGSRYVYVSSGHLYFYNGSSSVQLA